jgi:hypothetical protein
VLCNKVLFAFSLTALKITEITKRTVRVSAPLVEKPSPVDLGDA